jgi:3-dehydroquinate dehydratase / shikimate dehydrogenase
VSGRAAVCLVCAAGTVAEALRQASENRGRVDMLELRVDHLSPAEVAAAAGFPAAAGLPVILTVRRSADGGRFAGEERERVALIRRLSPRFAFVDLEEDLEAPGLEADVTRGGARIIRSFHDFAGVPAELARRVAALPRGPREIPKAAVMPGSTADLRRVIEACAAVSGERIVLGMGEHGLPTRLLATRLGCFLTYASPAGAPVAPGQVDPETLDTLYRFHSIGPSTAVLGVIGNPVRHTRSPRIHNRGFAAAGVDAVYIPFLVDRVPDFLPVADLLGVRGLSVTVPFKQEVIPHLARVDEVVRATGACNTMTRAGGAGAWSGTNTDVGGFLDPLREAFGGAIPGGLGATVIGAGGAARSVVHALRGCGARVLVLNRSPGRARELATGFGAAFGGLDDAGYRAAAEHGDVVVQATSAGMEPHPEIDPAPGLAFRAGGIAYDIVYSPDVTVFLRRARAAGCRIVRGRLMLVAQAMEQFRLFTGTAYPADLRTLLEEETD